MKTSYGKLLDLVAEDGLSLGRIPEEQRKRELCLRAMENNPLAAEYVPDHLLTETFCQEAVRRDGEALRVIPETRRTASVCRRAVRSWPGAMRYVPEHLRGQVAAAAY